MLQVIGNSIPALWPCHSEHSDTMSDKWFEQSQKPGKIAKGLSAHFTKRDYRWSKYGLSLVGEDEETGSPPRILVET